MCAILLCHGGDDDGGESELNWLWWPLRAHILVQVSGHLAEVGFNHIVDCGWTS